MTRLDLGDFMIRAEATAVGFSQQAPVPPVMSGDQFVYQNVPTGLWFGAAVGSAFRFSMTSGALFTSILNFPAGFADPFIVSADGVVLGSFLPGQSLAFPNGGVSEFIISGINPLLGQTQPNFFALDLTFNAVTASFTQQAISQP